MGRENSEAQSQTLRDQRLSLVVSGVVVFICSNVASGLLKVEKYACERCVTGTVTVKKKTKKNKPTSFIWLNEVVGLFL